MIKYVKDIWDAIFHPETGPVTIKDNTIYIGNNGRPSEEDKYMISIDGSSFNGGVFMNAGQPWGGSIVQGEGVSTGDPSALPKVVEKIAMKPVDVVEQLHKAPTNWAMQGLDDKIGILNDKISLTKNPQSQRELELLVVCMKNRKRYLDKIDKKTKSKTAKTFKDYYTGFDTTDQESVDKLLGKYKLVMNDSDIFVPEFPDEAIIIMKEFTKTTLALCNQKPNFFVIGEEKDFKKKYEKRDPILLAQSPFGLYFHILGAWDKEMILLTEL
jgi:hypothetical protein